MHCNAPLSTHSPIVYLHIEMSGFVERLATDMYGICT